MSSTKRASSGIENQLSKKTVAGGLAISQPGNQFYRV
jgi:hypothetical protein